MCSLRSLRSLALNNNNIYTDLVGRRKRCGFCAGCISSDCGSCTSCRDKPKFGGKGIKKQCCLFRRCNNLSSKRELDRK